MPSESLHPTIDIPQIVINEKNPPRLLTINLIPDRLAELTNALSIDPHRVNQILICSQLPHHPQVMGGYSHHRRQIRLFPDSIYNLSRLLYPGSPGIQTSYQECQTAYTLIEELSHSQQNPLSPGYWLRDTGLTTAFPFLLAMGSTATALALKDSVFLTVAIINLACGLGFAYSASNRPDHQIPTEIDAKEKIPDPHLLSLALQSFTLTDLTQPS